MQQAYRTPLRCHLPMQNQIRDYHSRDKQAFQTNYKFVIFDSVNNAKPDNYEWFDLFDSSNGILFDVDPDEQNAFDFEDDYDNVKITKDIAIVIKNNKKKCIKYSRR